MEIQLLNLSPELFSEFGDAILFSNKKPSAAGKGWVCWYPLAELASQRPPSLGVVIVQPKELIVSSMERHLNRPEWIIALDRPIVQCVSLSFAEDPDRPALNRTKAFVLYPGEGVRINPGVWHAVGMSFHETASSYMFILEPPTSEDLEIDNDWTGFQRGEIIHVV